MTTITLAIARENYLNNADFEEVARVTKCRAFLTACRQLLVLLPSAAVGPQRASVEFSAEMIERQIGRAQSWLAANGGDGSPDVVYPDFGGFAR